MNWHRICKVEELREGKPLSAEIGGVSVALFRVGQACHAVSNICTHELAFLSDGWQEGDIVECPLHQARFRVSDGKCLGPVAEEDLPVFESKIEDGDVWVAVPEEGP